MSTESGVSRDHLEHDALKMTEAEFGAAHPGPFLAFDVPEDDDDLHFLTEVPNRPPTRKNVALAPIQKRGDDGAKDAISVGRERERDVAVRDRSVSKLHAQFRRDGGVITLTDLGSHNGTKLDGVALAPHQPAVVKTGAAITFGSVATRVIDVAAAYALLRR